MGNTIASAFAHSSSTTTLRDFGVKLQNDGTITFDTAAFATAVDANPAQLEHLFVGQGGGTALAAAVTTLANDYTASGTGTLEAKKTGLQSLIKGFTTQIDKIEDGAVALGDRLRLQFSRLEQTMSGLQGQLSYISMIG
jgi:flagellar hook-associated protein 2